MPPRAHDLERGGPRDSKRRIRPGAASRGGAEAGTGEGSGRAAQHHRCLRPALLRSGRSRRSRRAGSRRSVRRRAVALEFRPPARSGARSRPGRSIRSIEEHGWQSTHTIIEIVNDDMPFLVDSVTMEVNRHGLTLHLIIHPIVAVVRDADGTLTGVAADERRERAARIVHPCRGRPHRRVRRSSTRLPPTSSACWTTCAPAFEDWKKMQRQRRARSSREIEKRPPPLPPDELAEGKAFLSLARRRPLHASRLSPPRPRRRSAGTMR